MTNYTVKPMDLLHYRYVLAELIGLVWKDFKQVTVTAVKPIKEIKVHE